MLNDPSQIEAAQALAAGILNQAPRSLENQLAQLGQRVLGRSFKTEERRILQSLHAKHYKDYLENLEAAKSLLSDPLLAANNTIPLPELAAMTSLARVVMNMHETITRN